MIAQTPPMGWNSWDCYGASVDEKAVRANADYMAKNLKRFGWEYVVVDIQWYQPTAKNHEYEPFADLCMDAFGRLMPAENRFPSAADGRGFAPLAEYVHSLGLKFGIHIMRGIPRQAVSRNLPIKGTDRTARQIAKTDSICCWNTDMYGVDPEKDGARAYYESLFELYASWGIDFIKVDDICRELPKEEKELKLISSVLRDCKREIVLSLSPGPALPEKAQLYKECANMWRITDDFWDKWELLYQMFERAQTWCIHSGPGSWPDCDMLPVGAILQDYDPQNRSAFTRDEQLTMMTLWCMMRSPLFIGCELTKLDDLTLSLFTNTEVLEILNHTHSAHPLQRRITSGKEQIVWLTTHENGQDYYMALFNCADESCEISARIPVPGSFDVMDVWSGEKTEPVTETVIAEVQPHGVRLFRLRKK